MTFLPDNSCTYRAQFRGGRSLLGMRTPLLLTPQGTESSMCEPHPTASQTLVKNIMCTVMPRLLLSTCQMGTLYKSSPQRPGCKSLRGSSSTSCFRCTLHTAPLSRACNWRHPPRRRCPALSGRNGIVKARVRCLTKIWDKQVLILLLSILRHYPTCCEFRTRRHDRIAVCCLQHGDHDARVWGCGPCFPKAH